MSAWIRLVAYLLTAIAISSLSAFVYFWVLQRTKSEVLKMFAFFIEGVLGILFPMLVAAIALNPLREIFPNAGMPGFLLVFGVWLAPSYFFAFAAMRKFPQNRKGNTPVSSGRNM